MQPKRKMPFLAGALVLLLVTIGWLGYSSVSRVAELTESLYNHPFAVSTAVLRIQRDVLGMHRAIKEIVLSTSPEEISNQQQFLSATEANILVDFKLLRERFLGDSALVQSALTHFEAWRPVRDEVIRLSLAGKPQEALLLAQTEGNEHVAAIEVSVAAVRDFAMNKAQEFRADAGQTRDQTLVFLLLALAIALLLAALVTANTIRIEKNWHTLNEQLESRVRQRTNELAVANENLHAQNEEITAMNEELSAQNEEIRAMNEEIDTLNQNLLSLNADLEQRVSERTADLTAAHEEITAQNEELTAQYEELKGMQENLKQEQVLTDALFNSVPGILYLYGEKGCLLRWNKEHERLTGYSAAELSKMTLLDWYKGDQETSERIAQEVANALATGFASAEANLLIKNGNRVPMYLTAVPLKLD